MELIQNLQSMAQTMPHVPVIIAGLVMAIPAVFAAALALLRAFWE